MKNLSTVKIPKDDWTSLNRELDNIRDLLKSIPQDVVNYVPSTTPTTTPALTGKYVLPASYPFTGSWAATGLKITIPQDGLYLINSHAPIYGTTAGFNSQPTVEMRLNGTAISGTKTNCYLYAEPHGGVINQIYPTDYSFTGDYKAGDIIEMYAWLQAGTKGYVYVSASESGAFIQYTQLSKNVPVVATLGQDAWVGPMQTIQYTGTGTLYYGKVKFTKDSSGQWFGEFWICCNNISITTTGITYLASGYDFYIAALSSDFTVAGGAYHSWFRFFNGTSSLATGQNSSSSGAYYISGVKVPLASKPVGYGIPDNV